MLISPFCPETHVLSTWLYLRPHITCLGICMIGGSCPLIFFYLLSNMAEHGGFKYDNPCVIKMFLMSFLYQKVFYLLDLDIFFETQAPSNHKFLRRQYKSFLFVALSLGEKEEIISSISQVPVLRQFNSSILILAQMHN